MYRQPHRVYCKWSSATSLVQEQVLAAVAHSGVLVAAAHMVVLAVAVRIALVARIVAVSSTGVAVHIVVVQLAQLALE